MTRRTDPEFQFPDLTKRRFNWRKWLAIAIVVVLFATAGFYLYRNIRAEPTLSEGDLIVNVNTATLDELETIPDIGPYKLNSIRPYVKVEGATNKR